MLGTHQTFAPFATRQCQENHVTVTLFLGTKAVTVKREYKTSHLTYFHQASSMKCCISAMHYKDDIVANLEVMKGIDQSHWRV